VTDKNRYDQAFIENFLINKDALNDSLEYGSVEEWDSVGHMTLISLLEDTFDIAMEMDDIIDFSSYKKGFELLAKYGVNLDTKEN